MPPRLPRSDSDAENFCPDDPEFLQEAPPEIGDLLSLHTSMSEFDEPPTMLFRFVKATIISAAIEFLLVVGAVILIFVRHQNASLWVLLLMFLVFSFFNVVITFGICLFSASFSHFCGYVGKEGCAYYAWSRSRDNMVEDKVLLYEEARDLRIATTHH